MVDQGFREAPNAVLAEDVWTRAGALGQRGNAPEGLHDSAVDVPQALRARDQLHVLRDAQRLRVGDVELVQVLAGQRLLVLVELLEVIALPGES